MMKNEDVSQFTYNTLGKIAGAFVDGMPTCHVHYGYDQDFKRYVLLLEYTGLYLRDLRCWLPDNIHLKYGNTQDTIILWDDNNE